MKIEEKVALSLDAESIWTVVNDIPTIAKCIPGVEEFSVEGDTVYRGRIKMKVGPVGVNFKGKITVLEVDPQQRTISMKAEANDARIGSNVKMIQTLSVTDVGEATNLAVTADVSIRGKLAQIGWGLIRPKVSSTLQEFAENLKSLMEERGGEMTV